MYRPDGNTQVWLWVIGFGFMGFLNLRCLGTLFFRIVIGKRQPDGTGDVTTSNLALGIYKGAKRMASQAKNALLVAKC